MAEAVFVPLSVAMLATCMDDLIEITAAEGAAEGEGKKGIKHKILEGIRGGRYYLSKLGKKIYVENEDGSRSLNPSLKKAVDNIKVTLSKVKEGVKAFKESGCAEKCKNAISSTKKLAGTVKDVIGDKYHTAMSKHYARKTIKQRSKGQDYGESLDKVRHHGYKAMKHRGALGKDASESTFERDLPRFH